MGEHVIFDASQKDDRLQNDNDVSGAGAKKIAGIVE